MQGVLHAGNSFYQKWLKPFLNVENIIKQNHLGRGVVGVLNDGQKCLESVTVVPRQLGPDAAEKSVNQVVSVPAKARKPLSIRYGSNAKEDKVFSGNLPYRQEAKSD